MSILMFGLISCKSDKTHTENTNGDITNSQESRLGQGGNTDGSTVPYPTQPRAAGDFGFSWVDNLNIRSLPSTKGKVVSKTRKGEVLTFTGEKSEEPETIVLRGVAYMDYWYMISTPDGSEGWIFGGAVKASDEDKGNPPISDSKFAFPYFGKFDLNEWEQVDIIDESGGDAEITTSTFQRRNRTLIISKVEVGDYGYERIYMLKENKKVIRERSLKFFADTDYHELREEVKNYASNPPMKYFRSQELSRHYTQFNARPMMVYGTWDEENLHEPPEVGEVNIESFKMNECRDIIDEDSQCICTFRAHPNNFNALTFVSEMTDLNSACIRLDGKMISLVGKRIDERINLKSRLDNNHWIELDENRGLFILGKASEIDDRSLNLQKLIEALQLLPKLPGKIPVITHGDISNSKIEAFENLASEALQIVQNKRSEGEFGLQMRMFYKDNQFDVYITADIKSWDEDGNELYDGEIEVRSKKAKSLAKRLIWGSCKCDNSFN